MHEKPQSLWPVSRMTLNPGSPGSEVMLTFRDLQLHPPGGSPDYPDVQGNSKRSIHFQKFILQKLLTLYPCPAYGWKGYLSKF
jgi:hypothetical protein